MGDFLGVDPGTSAVNVIVVDQSQAVRSQASEPLATSRPAAFASEQDPDHWWRAVAKALDRLTSEHPREMAGVVAVELSGPMNAALLLDPSNRPVRPAMLRNDGRAAREAVETRSLRIGLARRLGVPAVAGFRAPKLLWSARNEPATFREEAALRLANDFLRLRLTGDHTTDVSDAAGTWLLDEPRRDWSDEALAAVGLPSLLTRLVEGTEAIEMIRPESARRLVLPPNVMVASGAGDTPAGGLCIGAVEEGEGFVSPGTSARRFAATSSYRPAPERPVTRIATRFRDAGAMMAAGPDIGRLLDDAEVGTNRHPPLMVLPYLAGERTRHDDPHFEEKRSATRPGSAGGVGIPGTRVEPARAIRRTVAEPLEGPLLDAPPVSTERGRGSAPSSASPMAQGSWPSPEECSACPPEQPELPAPWSPTGPLPTRPFSQLKARPTRSGRERYP